MESPQIPTWLHKFHHQTNPNRPQLFSLQDETNPQHIIASVVGLTARMNNTELAVVIQALQNKLRTLAADSPIEVPIKLEGQSDHKSKQRNHKSKQRNDKSKHIEDSRCDKMIESVVRRTRTKQHYICYEPIAPKFTSKQDRLQYQHKAMVARCFCDRDYGSKHLYEMMQSTNNNLNIPINRYHALASSVTISTYRRLEMFMQQEFRLLVQPASRIQVLVLTRVLHQCRTRLSSSLCHTFLKFVRLSFSLNPKILISNEQAMDLHQSLRAWLSQQDLSIYAMKSRTDRQDPGRFRTSKRKQSNQSGFDKSSFQSFMRTPEVQRFMLQQYRISPSLYYVYDQLIAKYPHKEHQLPLPHVKSKFIKLLRTTFRRAQNISENYNIDPKQTILNLGLQAVESLFSHELAIGVRMLLIDLCLQSNNQSQQAHSIIVGLQCEIEEYLNVRRELYMNEQTGGDNIADGVCLQKYE